jgi:hypothetical protein
MVALRGNGAAVPLAHARTHNHGAGVACGPRLPCAHATAAASAVRTSAGTSTRHRQRATSHLLTPCCAVPPCAHHVCAFVPGATRHALLLRRQLKPSVKKESGKSNNAMSGLRGRRFWCVAVSCTPAACALCQRARLHLFVKFAGQRLGLEFRLAALRAAATAVQEQPGALPLSQACPLVLALRWQRATAALAAPPPPPPPPCFNARRRGTGHVCSLAPCHRLCRLCRAHVPAATAGRLRLAARRSKEEEGYLRMGVAELGAGKWAEVSH